MPIQVIARGNGSEHVSETAFTSSVNAHGALIYLKHKVAVGSKLIVKNIETEEEQFVRVIRSNPAPEGRTEVAIEFLRPAPKFWRIAFPPEDWAPHSAEITADSF
jgi:hypothetical protein